MSRGTSQSERTAKAVPLIGAHVPASGGLAKRGLSYADAIGAECVQVFVTNPRGWAPSKGDAQQDAAFREIVTEQLPAYVHASFLINLYGPSALFFMIAAGHVLLVLFGLQRMRMRPTPSDRTRYTYAPRTSFIIGRLMRRKRDKPKE